MSVRSVQQSVQRVQSDISSLQVKLADIAHRKANNARRLVQLQNNITSTSSVSVVQSRMRDIARIQDEQARIQRDEADTDKRIADKNKDLFRFRQDLVREEERERRRVEDTERRRQREREQYYRDLEQQLQSQRLLGELSVEGTMVRPAQREYDFFISHASEDKDDFVRPLAQALEGLGVSVWYDEFQLRVGDSLRRSIDRGLVDSRYGVVVLSGSFFAKGWPQYELDGMVAREMNGVKVILPIWHRVTKDQVMEYSPTLADKLALNSSLMSVDEIARELVDLIRG